MLDERTAYSGFSLQINHYTPSIGTILDRYGVTGCESILQPMSAGNLTALEVAALALRTTPWVDDTVRGRDITSYARPADLKIGGEFLPIDGQIPEALRDHSQDAAYDKPACLVGVDKRALINLILDTPELDRVDFPPVERFSVAALHEALRSGVFRPKPASYNLTDVLSKFGKENGRLVYSMVSSLVYYGLLHEVVEPDGKIEIDETKNLELGHRGLFGRPDVTPRNEGMYLGTIGNIALQLIQDYWLNALPAQPLSVLGNDELLATTSDYEKMHQLDQALAKTLSGMDLTPYKFIYSIIKLSSLKPAVQADSPEIPNTSLADLIIANENIQDRRVKMSFRKNLSYYIERAVGRQD